MTGMEFQSKNFAAEQISQLFIQYFCHKHCVKECNLDRLLDGYRKHSNEQIDRNLLLSKSVKNLRSFGLTIRRVFDEASKETFFVLINIGDSSIGQNLWSQHENGYFFALLEQIVDSFVNCEDELNEESELNETLSIGSTQAINLARNCHISMVLGEKLIKTWIGQHWLVKTDDGKLTFGIRTITDFTAYLIGKFPFLSTCDSCRFVCFLGRHCSNCATSFHKHCSFTSSDRNFPGFRCSACNGELSEVKKLIATSQPEQQE